MYRIPVLLIYEFYDKNTYKMHSLWYFVVQCQVVHLNNYTRILNRGSPFTHPKGMLLRSGENIYYNTEVSQLGEHNADLNEAALNDLAKDPNVHEAVVVGMQCLKPHPRLLRDLHRRIQQQSHPGGSDKFPKCNFKAPVFLHLSLGATNCMGATVPIEKRRHMLWQMLGKPESLVHMLSDKRRFSKRIKCKKALQFLRDQCRLSLSLYHNKQ